MFDQASCALGILIGLVVGWDLHRAYLALLKRRAVNRAFNKLQKRHPPQGNE